MTAIDRIDVSGAAIAARVYTPAHPVNDYKRNVLARKDWDVPMRAGPADLRLNPDAIVQTPGFLVPGMEIEVSGPAPGNLG